MHFCHSNLGTSWSKDFGGRLGPTSEHTAAINSFPAPQDIKQFQRFLGMVNFYHHFLPNWTCILRPLTYLLKGSPKLWVGLPRPGSFSKCKAPPSCSSATSASLPPSWAFFGQMHFRFSYWRRHAAKIWWPLASSLFLFQKKKLTNTESCYSMFNRELLAAYVAICHFHNFCEGHPFQLWTDYKPLVTALSCVTAPISQWQQQHLAFISEFNVHILYLPGLKK